MSSQTIFNAAAEVLFFLSVARQYFCAYDIILRSMTFSAADTEEAVQE